MKKLIIIIIIILTVSCSAKKGNYYMLTSTADHEGVKKSKNLMQRKIISLYSVSTDEYLHRNAIVSKSDPNNITIANYNFWGEPLDRNITNVVADNLNKKLSNYVVLADSWGLGVSSDYTLKIYIEKFDIDNFTSCRIVANWKLYDVKKNKLLAFNKSVHNQQMLDITYPAAAVCFSELLNTFSNDIAHKIDE